MKHFPFILLLVLAVTTSAAVAQSRSPQKRALQKSHVVKSVVVENPLEIFGIRPGISFDSVNYLMRASSATMREVHGEDSISRSYSDNPAHVYVVDSLICRLTYMRMAFVFDGANRLRRLTITPRESSIEVGASDDIENVLLLYFGQNWGKPELELAPPLPMFHWRTGNIDVRGFIRRGYPMWVLEG